MNVKCTENGNQKKSTLNLSISDTFIGGKILISNKWKNTENNESYLPNDYE